MKLQLIASVAAVLLNSGHGVFAAKDELKGLRGSIDFYKRDGNDGGGGGGGGGDSDRCYNDCCKYAGEDQVLLGLGYRKANCNRCGDLNALCNGRVGGGGGRGYGYGDGDYDYGRGRGGGRGKRGRRGYYAPYYEEEE